MIARMNPLEIQRMHVRRGILDLEARCDIDALHVTPDQAERALDLLPNLARHICVNSASNDRFGEELEGTELPHLLEHIIIELQGKAHAAISQGQGASLTGHTSWLEEPDVTSPQGYALMRTSVSFANDFMALAATKASLDLIAWICDPSVSARPDIDVAVARVAKHGQESPGLVAR